MNCKDRNSTTDCANKYEIIRTVNKTITTINSNIGKYHFDSSIIEGSSELGTRKIYSKDGVIEKLEGTYYGKYGNISFTYYLQDNHIIYVKFIELAYTTSISVSDSIGLDTIINEDIYACNSNYIQLLSNRDTVQSVSRNKIDSVNKFYEDVISAKKVE